MRRSHSFIARVACALEAPLRLRRAFAVAIFPWGGSRDARRRREDRKVEPPEVRGRLLTALGWAAGAFAAIAVSSSELARVLGPKLGGFGMSSAALCAVFASLGFMVVLRFARRLDAREHNGAQVLLLATVLVSALLLSLLVTALAPAAAVELIPISVVNVAGSAVAAFLIAVTIPSRRVRGLVLSSIVLGPFLVLAPELTWLGLVCALLLVLAVEVVLHRAREMAHAPEPALAACLVAGVLAVPVLVVYFGVRFILRSARFRLPSLRVLEPDATGDGDHSR